MRNNWIVGSLAVILSVLVVLVVSEAFAGGTTAGTTITESGGATWGASGSGSSNNVSTTVEAAYGMEMTTTPTNDSGDAGASVIYNFTVKNIANCSDTLTFTVSGNSWTSTPSDASIVLAADASHSFTVTVDIPSDAVNDATDGFTMTIKDQNDAATEDDWPSTGNDTIAIPLTTTAHAPHIALVMTGDKASEIPAYPTAKPYEVITYTMTYDNDGAASASSMVLTNAVPSDTKYVRDSAGATVHAGIATIEYFDGSTWETTQPTADGDGCCPTITQIRFTFDTAVAVAENGSVTFQARIK